MMVAGWMRAQFCKPHLKRGLSREQRRGMNVQDALRLILLPNFSMAHAVTTNAGRGIGMSVVQERLNAVGGRIEIQSELGRGTTFTLDVPRLVGLIEVETGAHGRARLCDSDRRGRRARASGRQSEIANHQKELNEWRILDVETLKRVTKAQLTSPAGVPLVEFCVLHPASRCVGPSCWAKPS